MRTILILTLTVLAVVLISCATPPEQPDQPVDTSVPLPEEELEEAKSLKKRVDDNGLAEFAMDDYNSAEASLKEGEEAYGKDNAEAKSALDAAIASYRKVISEAYPAWSRRSRDEVEGIKTNAENIKAPVAMKSEYAAAKAKYDEAVAAMDAGDYEEAISLFTEAKSLFQDVYEKTLEKKAAAETDLKATQDGIKDAEERAKAGDEELQGGGQ
jgi:tetratricopeptide (TPR) repeat protein